MFETNSLFNNDKVTTRVIVVKVNIDGISNEHIKDYLEVASQNLVSKSLKEQGYEYWFIPVRDQVTTITFIDLEKMTSVSV